MIGQNKRSGIPYRFGQRLQPACRLHTEAGMKSCFRQHLVARLERQIERIGQAQYHAFAGARPPGLQK